VAPWLGFGLNVVRVFVVAVMAMAGPEVPGPFVRNHSIQGVAVLAVGTGVLYAMGLWMAGGRVEEVQSPQPVGDPIDRKTRLPGPGLAAVWLVLIAVLSLTLPPFPRKAAPDVSVIEIPERRAGWTATTLYAYGPFVGALPREQILFRRFERKPVNQPIEVVELFIALEAVGIRAIDRVFTSKLAMSNADWSIDDAQPIRLWSLQRDGMLIDASRGSERTMSYVWRVRDAGLWREAARAALALEYSPLRRPRPRVAVRLRTAIAFGGQLGRDRAKQRLDRFIVDFRTELAGL